MFRLLPEATPIIELDCRSIGPVQALLPATLSKAPVAPTPMPLPLIASGSAIVTPPCTCNAAPLATVVPAVVAPKAVAFCAFSTPWATVVSPV